VSAENVEVVRSLVSAAHRGDWQAALALYDPAVELDMTRMPGGFKGVGVDAVQRFFQEWFGAWDHLAVTPERFVDAGDVVIAVVRISGVGRTSGVAISMHAADVMTVRGGKVVRDVGYADASEALRTAGVSV
jgi:ketosteroid isomerase-like protein